MTSGILRSTADRLFSAARSVRRSIDPRPVILMYHRVAELRTDPNLLAVQPAQFAEQLEVLRTRFRPCSLAELVGALAEQRLHRRAVVVTIDDGYADSLLAAKPLLEQFEVPATVFVTTDSVGGEREFWWDELERLLLLPGRAPSVLRLELDGGDREWELGEAAEYTGADAEQDRWWNIEADHDPGPRQRAFRSLYELLHPLANDDKWRGLAQIRHLVKAAPNGRGTHRALDHEELLRLSEGTLIDIGAHTRTHPALANLPAPDQRDEISQSKATLEAILERPVSSFAYPHGSYASETLAAVREAGYACACTSDAASISPKADPFLLPRLVPRDWDGDRFSRWLSAWVG